MSYDEQALEYHLKPRPGKTEIRATKPTATQHDLSLAYTPGVAAPCREIQKDADKGYDYTNKGNLVAVISNGTAVLGLGNIGPLAGKPVMEGKAVLFKRFAFVDVFDIEVAETDPDRFIAAVKALEPTFGGINLEDIKAPECFYIEETLEREMDIPVFHDDQHGTAIISGAAFLNAVELTGRDIEAVRVVVSGAGAAGMACAKMLFSLGVLPENLTMCDSRGVIYKGRERGMNAFKERFARDTRRRTLADAFKDADAFLGLSAADSVSQDMVRSMAKDPIVFAMANPDPEITYPEARAARADAIVATGRSDYPNQVNNVLGFPFIFRGALDTRSRYINTEMKLAAVRSLAELAKKDVPESVSRAYGGKTFKFGRDYLIPKPFDPRVLYYMATAVAEAAMRTGSARVEVDLDAYREKLKRLVDPTRMFVGIAVKKAQRELRRIAFPEGRDEKVLKAAQAVVRNNVAVPVLFGPEDEVRAAAAAAGVKLDGVTVFDPDRDERGPGLRRFLRERGEDVAADGDGPLDPFLSALAAVEAGMCDGLCGGMGREYGAAIRPALRLVGRAQGVRRAAGVHVLFLQDKTLFFADTTLNVDPSADDLCEIALLAAEFVRGFNVEPVVGMISFANLGENPHPASTKVAHAVAKIRGRAPGLKVAGELQADVALNPEAFSAFIPKERHHGASNVLVFPNLDAANAAFRLVKALTGAEVLGPFIVGLERPVNIMPRGSTSQDLIGMTAITAALATGRSGAPV